MEKEDKIINKEGGNNRTSTQEIRDNRENSQGKSSEQVVQSETPA